MSFCTSPFSLRWNWQRLKNRLVDKDMPEDLDEYVMKVIGLDNRLQSLHQPQKFGGSNRRTESQRGNFGRPQEGN